MIHGFVSAFPGHTARGVACLLVVAAPLFTAQSKEPSLTLRVANQAMERWPDGRIGPERCTGAWGFELGIVLAGMNAVWSATNESAYLAYLKHAVDQFVQPDGTIRRLRLPGIFAEQYPPWPSATGTVSDNSRGKIPDWPLRKYGSRLPISRARSPEEFGTPGLPRT